VTGVSGCADVALDIVAGRVQAGVMPDDEKSDPIEDVRKGLGLLFRAAKTSIDKLPTKELEQAVVTSAREVGRAFESVGKTIEREVFGKTDDKSPPPTDEASKPEEPPPEEPKPPPDGGT
jgi:hypothetical protein